MTIEIPGSNPLEKFKNFDRNRGRTPINPGVIEGFEDGDWGPDLDDDEPVTPFPSQRANPLPEPEPETYPIPQPQPVVRADIDFGKFALVITDRNAILEDNVAQLTESEVAAIKAIVLRNLKRKLDEQYKTLTASMPKRPRVRRVVNGHDAAPKKRGRPKKDAPVG